MTARERLIESAIELLRRNGVAGTGLADLLEHSGTARRSVYVNFPGGKSELMTEATRTAGRLMDSTLASIAAGGDQPLVAFADSWKQTLRASDYADARSWPPRSGAQSRRRPRMPPARYSALGRRCLPDASGPREWGTTRPNRWPPPSWPRSRVP